MPHCEISPKLYHVRLYGEDPNAYCASYQLFVDGDRGTIYGLNGTDYYRYALQFIGQMFEETGVKEVFAEAPPQHVAFMEAALKGHCHVERVRDAEHSGRDMVLIRLSRL